MRSAIKLKLDIQMKALGEVDFKSATDFFEETVINKTVWTNDLLARNLAVIEFYTQKIAHWQFAS